jgi:hypothetical protein
LIVELIGLFLTIMPLLRFSQCLLLIGVVCSSLRPGVESFVMPPRMTTNFSTLSDFPLHQRQCLQVLEASSWLGESIPTVTITMILGDSDYAAALASKASLSNCLVDIVAKTDWTGLMPMLGFALAMMIPAILAIVEGNKIGGDGLIQEQGDEINDKDVAIHHAESHYQQRRTAAGVTQSNSRNASKPIAMDRRGSIMALVGSAAGLLASDMLLGAAGKNILTSVTESSIISPYHSKWNGLYRRLATLKSKYGVTASPELVEWVAKSQAVITKPELAAWVAAQRAMLKSRQVVAAAVGLEEGIVTVATAAATASMASKSNDVSDQGSTDSEKKVNESTNTKDEITSPYPTNDSNSIKTQYDHEIHLDGQNEIKV